MRPEISNLLRIYRSLGLAKRPRKRLPTQAQPKSIERAYASELLALVKAAEAELKPLLDALPSLLPERSDADEVGRIARLMAQATAALQRKIQPVDLERLARRIAGRVADHNKAQLGRQLQAAIGIDIRQADRKLPALIDGFAAENVSLIKDLAPKMYGEVERAVIRAVQRGTRHEELAKEIQARINITENRAKLVARDQVLSLNANINQARQQELGLTEYRWNSVGDQRARPAHVALNGRVFKWSDPPSEGHPGTAIQCRCFAEPVFNL